MEVMHYRLIETIVVFEYGVTKIKGVEGYLINRNNSCI